MNSLYMYYALSFVLVEDSVCHETKILPFLYSDEEVEKVFSPPPIVSYRSAC